MPQGELSKAQQVERVTPPKARSSGVQLPAVEGTGLGLGAVSLRDFVIWAERTRSRGSARIWRPEHQRGPSPKRQKRAPSLDSRAGSAPLRRILETHLGKTQLMAVALPD